MNENDDVAVTGAFLSLVKALQSARQVYISESSIAEDLELDIPDDFDTRCRDLFFNRYRQAVAALGLAANEQTYEALMRLQVPEEAWRTDFADLPNQFVFNPWLGMGYGGIKVVSPAFRA